MPKPLTAEIDTRLIFHERTRGERDGNGMAGARATVGMLNTAAYLCRRGVDP